MKVLILTEGGIKIGFGHITRCLSIYQAFREKNITPEFLINGDKTINILLKDTRYKLFNWIQEKNKLFRLAKGTDIAIIDSYIASFSLYKKISKSVKLPVYIDDTRRLDYPEGMVINGSIDAGELNYPRKKNIGYMLGAKYIPLRREFWNASKKTVKKNIENAMITFGGDDAANMTSKILKFLGREYPKLVKNVVIGKGFKNIRQIENLKSKQTNLIYYPDAEKMKRLMSRADFAVSAGGQTLYELARIGVPTVAIAVAANQMANIKGWQRAGFIKYAGWWQDKNMLIHISKNVDAILPYKTRLRCKKMGNKLIDGKGPKRIVTALYNRVKLCD